MFATQPVIHESLGPWGICLLCLVSNLSLGSHFNLFNQKTFCKTSHFCSVVCCTKELKIATTHVKLFQVLVSPIFKTALINTFQADSNLVIHLYYNLYQENNTVVPFVPLCRENDLLLTVYYQ